MIIVPTINGQRLGVWDAQIVSYTVGACDYSNGYLLPPRSVFPVGLDGNIGLRPVVLDLDFEGTAHQITKNISNLTVLLQQGVEILLPDGFYYRCVFKSASDAVEKAPWIKRCKFTLYGLCHDNIHSETLSESGYIIVEGNRETPVIYEITPAQGATEVTVNGITVSEISGTVTINGIEKTVMQDGVNKFADTNITKFPSLLPGNQQITVVGSATVKVSYYPIYA